MVRVLPLPVRALRRAFWGERTRTERRRRCDGGGMAGTVVWRVRRSLLTGARSPGCRGPDARGAGVPARHSVAQRPISPRYNRYSHA